MCKEIFLSSNTPALKVMLLNDNLDPTVVFFRFSKTEKQASELLPALLNLTAVDRCII